MSIELSTESPELNWESPTEDCSVRILPIAAALTTIHCLGCLCYFSAAACSNRKRKISQISGSAEAQPPPPAEEPPDEPPQVLPPPQQQQQHAVREVLEPPPPLALALQPPPEPFLLAEEPQGELPPVQALEPPLPLAQLPPPPAAPLPPPPVVQAGVAPALPPLVPAAAPVAAGAAPVAAVAPPGARAVQEKELVAIPEEGQQEIREIVQLSTRSLAWLALDAIDMLGRGARLERFSPLHFLFEAFRNPISKQHMHTIINKPGTVKDQFLEKFRKGNMETHPGTVEQYLRSFVDKLRALYITRNPPIQLPDGWKSTDRAVEILDPLHRANDWDGFVRHLMLLPPPPALPAGRRR